MEIDNPGDRVLHPDDIRLFLATVRAGGFSAAGQQVGMTRSAVSRRIDQLESRIGVRLLQRTTRHFSLTEPGQAFFEKCSHIIEELDYVENALLEEFSTPRGDIRINCAVMIGLKLIIPRLDELKESQPNLRFHIDLSDQPVQRNDQQHDIYIRFGAVEDPNLVSSLLARSSRILCAAPSYIAKHGSPNSIEDLNQHTCLLISGLGSNFNDWIFQDNGNRITFRATGNLIFNSGDGHYEALIAGLGIGRVTQILAQNDIDAGRLVPILGDKHSSVAEPIHALFHGGTKTPKKVRSVVEYFRKSLKKI